MMNFDDFCRLRDDYIEYFNPCYDKERDFSYKDGKIYRVIPSEHFINNCCYILNASDTFDRKWLFESFEYFLNTVFHCIEEWYGSMDDFFEKFEHPENLKNGWQYAKLTPSVFDEEAVFDAYAYYVNNKPKEVVEEKAEEKPKRVGYKAALDNRDGSFDEIAYTETMTREEFYERLSKSYDMETIRISEYELAS